MIRLIFLTALFSIVTRTTAHYKDATDGVKWTYTVVSIRVFSLSGEPKHFGLSKFTDNIKNLGLNKGKKYRWLVHDCMSKHTQMHELAKVFKTNYPDDNVILLDWFNMRTTDIGLNDYDEFRQELEYTTCALLFAMYLIHAGLYNSESPSVRENSHIIGFGHGAVIAAHAGWLANHKDKQRIKWNYADKYTIENFVMSRVTVIDPVQYCSIEGDYKRMMNQCKKLKDHGFPALLITQDCAKFVDGFYTSFRATHYSLCARENKPERRGLQHHRGVHFVDNKLDDEKVGGCVWNPGYHITKHCSELAKQCVHQMALKFYVDAMRLLNGTIPSECSTMLDKAFGDTDPNRPGETLAVNIHIQSKSPDVLKGDYGCEAIETDFPDLEMDRIVEHCAANEMVLEADQTWNFNKY